SPRPGCRSRWRCRCAPPARPQPQRKAPTPESVSRRVSSSLSLFAPQVLLPQRLLCVELDHHRLDEELRGAGERPCLLVDEMPAKAQLRPRDRIDPELAIRHLVE